MNISTSNTLSWLLKREFWEHKGGFFWTPIVSGGIFLLLSAMAIIAGETMRVQEGGADRDIQINGVQLNQLTKTLSPEDLSHLGGGLDLSMLLAGTWPLIAMAFVIFFYCLGALYDERKDRSILFWKSLPLSDGQTVLSKALSALMVAPLLATAAAIVVSLLSLVLLSIYALYQGGNPIDLIWGPASPLSVAANLVALLPLFTLWALPTVGWLLLVSAWAKSKPFLWALLIPVFSGILVTWFDVMELFGSSAGWFWQHIVGRLLTGTLPGINMVYFKVNDPAMAHFDPEGPKEIAELFSVQSAYGMLAMPELWIGVAAGVAMIFGAIYFRRHRDEG